MEFFCDWTLSILLRGTFLLLLLAGAERLFRLRPGRKILWMLLAFSFLPPGPYAIPVSREIPLATAITRQDDISTEPVTEQWGRAKVHQRVFPVRNAKRWIVLSLFAVGILLLGRRLRQMRRWNLYVRKQPTIHDTRMNKALTQARRICGIHREIRLIESSAGPLSCGVLHPAILLPEEKCKALNEDQFQMLLVHECRHLKRQDPLRTRLLALWETAFWFHPLLHSCRRRFTELRETECDRETARLLNFSYEDRFRYAGLIFDFAVAGDRLPVIACTPLGACAGAIKQRMQEITMKSIPASFHRKLLLLLALTAGGAISGCLTPKTVATEPGDRIVPEIRCLSVPLDSTGMALELTADRDEELLRIHCKLNKNGKTLAAPKLLMRETDPASVIMEKCYEGMEQQLPLRNFGAKTIQGAGFYLFLSGQFLDTEHADVKCSLFIRQFLRWGENREMMVEELVREYHFPRMKLGKATILDLSRQEPGQL